MDSAAAESELPAPNQIPRPKITGPCVLVRTLIQFDIIFQTNFFRGSMEWTKIEQQETYLLKRHTFSETALDCDIYKDHLILLRSGYRSSRDFEKDVLCCWNIRILFLISSLIQFIETNSWSTFDIKSLGFNRTGNFVVYKDLLLACAEDRKGLGLAILNLESIFTPFLSS